MFHLLHQLDVDGNARSRIYVDNHAFELYWSIDTLPHCQECMVGEIAKSQDQSRRTGSSCPRMPAWSTGIRFSNVRAMNALERPSRGLAPLRTEPERTSSGYLIGKMERETGLEPEDICLNGFQWVLISLFSIELVLAIPPRFSVSLRLVITNYHGGPILSALTPR